MDLELIGGRLHWRGGSLALDELEPGRHVLEAPVTGAGWLAPRVMIGRGGELRRVRARARDGALEVTIDRVPARAEVHQIRLEGFWLILRTGPEGVVVAVGEDGRVVRGRAGRIDLERLAAEGDGRWSLWIQCSDGRRLRIARHGDGVCGKEDRAALPGWTSEGRRAQLRFDGEEGLTVVTGPDGGVPALPSPGEVGRTSLRRRVLTGPALAVHACVLAALRLLPAPGRDPAAVRIVVGHAWGMGGTVRATLDLAARLAERRPVEVVSLVRHRIEPFFAFPAGVRVVALDDLTRPARRRERLLRRLPSVLVHPEDHARAWGSALTDVRLARTLRRSAGVVITTRPGLAIAAAAAVPRATSLIAQEHMHFGAHRTHLGRAARRAYGRADALVVLTEQDRRDYAGALAATPVTVAHIPNSLPDLGDDPPGEERPVVVAAGRLNPQKGFDLLIRAFAMIAPAHEDWSLRIHGAGPERRALQRLIREHELHDRVLLMGPTRHVGPALAAGSVFALSSRFEGFGIVLLEAMSRGLAVVSYACPRGPAEIVTHGSDGLLARPGDVAGLARALDAAMSDAALRRRLGERARITARRYAPALVGAQWDALLSDHGSAIRAATFAGLTANSSLPAARMRRSSLARRASA